MTEVRKFAVFGKRTERHTVIIARGSDIRHFTIRPWLVSVIGSVLSAVAIGYLLATSYLVLRDDLIGATVARQARMQQAYEDRISALRAQVDRITSRQLLDQQLMERKVGELLERQAQLSQRHGRIGPILDRATGGVKTRESVPVPTPRPDIRASLDAPGIDSEKKETQELAYAAQASGGVPWPIRQGFEGPAADKTDHLFVAINRSLRTIESEQIGRITSLTENAYEAAESIASALKKTGIDVDADYEKSGLGGPLLRPLADEPFESRVRELDEALDTLETLKKEARRLPLHNPTPGSLISSGFGMRTDPLIGSPAHHSGIDFRARSGTPVSATGDGRVVKAGWNGGYGRMVEIDHGNGISTRYGHLSKLKVKVGQTVSRGDIVGRTGNSGRSTGPHLHYEVRRHGDAVNPMTFLNAGKRIRAYL